MPVPLPSSRARLTVEQLEDRSTPSGTQVPAGEFNWTQVAPNGSLTQLIWDGSALVYRVKNGSSWSSEVVAVESGTFTRAQYDDQRQLQTASQSAQLVFTTDGTPHAFYLAEQWVPSSNGFRSQFVHMARTGSGWHQVETISVPWVSKWGPNNLVAAAGPNNSISFIFTETYSSATGAGAYGTGMLWYATNKSGAWAYDKIADTSDMSQDNWFIGGRIAPRWLSLAVDSNGAAHVTYTTGFHVQAAFSKAKSDLLYATNKTGSWKSELVYTPPDGTGDAALGASIAVSPNGQVSIAGYFVDRYDTGSPLTAKLHYYTQKSGGGWNVQVVASVPDAYAAGDGSKFTGMSPKLFFDSKGQANIVFSDSAAQHLPVTYANEFSGQIRLATLSGGKWNLTTIYRQNNPLYDEMFYPLAVQYQGKIVVTGVKSINWLDSNLNAVKMDFTLVEANGPTVTSPPPPASPPPPPASPPPPPPAPPPPPPPPPPVSPPPPPPPPVSPPPPPPPPPRVPPPPPSTPAPQPPTTVIPKIAYAVGADAVGQPVVALYSDTNTLIGHITPFNTSHRGGVRVATADVNKDGYLDVVCGSGVGDPSRLQVWDGKSRTLMFDVDPFGGFKGGVYVATGDFNADGHADIVVVPDAGGGPRVQVWSGKTLQKLTPDFFGIDHPGLLTGLRVAAGDINRDGFDDLAFAPGPGGGPRVSTFDGRTFLPNSQPMHMLHDFFIIDPRMTSGIFLTIGDITGDGYGEIIASADRGSAPRVQAMNGLELVKQRHVLAADFYAGNPNSRSGVRVATAEVTGQGPENMIIGVGPGGGSRVYVHTGAHSIPTTWFDVFPGFQGGVFVG